MTDQGANSDVTAFKPVSARFKDKVAIVTGAASGIGAAIARRLVAEGASVIGGDVNGILLSEVSSKLGDRFTGVLCDVTQESDIVRMVETAVETRGSVSVAFNVAGAARTQPIVELSEADWDFTVDLCMKGVFLALKHEARAMIAGGGGGAIINIASVASTIPSYTGSAYSSAKAGVAMLGRSAALELAEHQIRVSTVSPGLTVTPLVGPATGLPEVYNAFMDKIPLRRPASVEDIAAAALFLASEEASYITGVNLFSDGGWDLSGYPDLRPLLKSIQEYSDTDARSA